MMQDYSRPGDNCRNSRELLDVIFQKQEEHRSEAGSRISTLLTRDNGNISRPSSFSRRSLNLSRQSLASAITLCHEKESCVFKLLYSLGLLSVSSLFISALSLQILFSLGGTEVDLAPQPPSLVNSSSPVYERVREVSIALTSFVIMLDSCCLMVCTMQCFFAAKILVTPQGEERALKYLRECSSSRVIAVFGFFLSIPGYIIAVILYMVMRFEAVPAMTSSIIMGGGILFCILSVMQNTYHWRIEKNRADEGLPVYEVPPNSHKNPPEAGGARNELSTLV